MSVPVSALILRRDHIAGGVFIAGPAGFRHERRPAVRHARLAGRRHDAEARAGLLIAFGAILVARAGESPPLAAINGAISATPRRWSGVTAVATALYTTIGFVLSVSLLLFVLLYFIERRSLLSTLAVSIGVTVGCYLLFGTLLKSPLPPMPFWY